MQVKFKNFCNRHIMLELPTIKTDFLFENSQDFNQTTHARPQHPIVFIDIISLYFNCTSSVKYLFQMVTSQSCHAFFCSTTQAPTQKRWEKCLCIVWNANFLLFSHFKMAASEAGYQGDSKRSFS